MAQRGTNRVPPKQQPYEQAFALGFDSLISRSPPDEHLGALGAERRGSVIRLPVLNRWLLVDEDAREVIVEDAGRARRAWAILALHYLCAEDVSLDAREVSLGHFTDCASYLSVFNSRIIGRFLATVGRDPQLFAERAEEIGGARLDAGGQRLASGLGYRFDVFPRLPIAVVRYEGDEELGPGAGVIYRADAQHLLPAEDRIVAAELLLDSLAGKPVEEK